MYKRQALLKSGRINNRLLCELATHKDFIKFLADIEIYVDGIATMQIDVYKRQVLRSAYDRGAFAGSRISLWTIPRFSG